MNKYSYIPCLFLTMLSTSVLAGDTVRDQHIKTLVSVVGDCIWRHETDHPVFQGCLDWHSSVHAYWAIIWAGQVTGDARLSRKALVKLNSSAIQQELMWFRQRDQSKVQFEMPYGRAWFLQLARDVEKLHGSASAGSMRPMADYFYKSLLNFARLGGGSVIAADYDNASWYLYQLHQWATMRGLKSDVDELETIIVNRFDRKLNWIEQNAIQGFIDPQLMAVVLLSGMEKASEVYSRISDKINDRNILPLLFPLNFAHQGGLNFSRSWGLAVLANTGKDSKYETILRQHRQVMFDSIEHWSNDYKRYGHWVAQFGIFSYRIESDYIGYKKNK